MATESNIKIVIEVDNTQAIGKLQETKKAILDLSNVEIKAAKQTVDETIKSNNQKFESTRKRLTDEEKIQKMIHEKWLRQQAKERFESQRTEKDKEDAYKKSLAEQARMAKMAGTANYALINLNRTISDAPFFMRDMSMGIVAISNNLDPLIQSFVQAKQESGSWGSALKAIGGQLMGTGGLLIAFGLVNAAITAFALSQDNAKEKTDKQTEAIKKQKDELVELNKKILKFSDPLTNTMFNFKNIDDLNKAISKGEETLKNYAKIYGSESEFNKLMELTAKGTMKADVIENINNLFLTNTNFKEAYDKASQIYNTERKQANDRINDKKKELEDAQKRLNNLEKVAKTDNEKLIVERSKANVKRLEAELELIKEEQTTYKASNLKDMLYNAGNLKATLTVLYSMKKDYEKMKDAIRIAKESGIMQYATEEEEEKPTNSFAKQEEQASDFLSKLEDEYKKLTLNRFAYERWKANQNYNEEMTELKKFTNLSTKVREDAETTIILKRKAALETIDNEQMERLLNDIDEIVKNADDITKRREEAEEMLAEYEIELGENILARQLANIQKWYFAKKQTHDKQLKDEVITLSTYEKAIDELEKVKNKRIRESQKQEYRRQKQERNKILADLREEYEVLDILTQDAANTLRDAFMSAWRDAFGEANSLFEKFISSVVSDLASLGTKYLAQGLFNTILGLIPGGSGVAAIAHAAAGSGKPMSQTIVNLSLDGQIVDRRVINNYGNYQSVAKSRRMI